MKIKYVCLLFFIIPTYCGLIPNNRVINSTDDFSLVEGITYNIIHLKSGSKLDNNDDGVFANFNPNFEPSYQHWSLRKSDGNWYNIINAEASLNLDSDGERVYISSRDHNSMTNPYQRWRFENIRDDIYKIAHMKSYYLDSNGKDVYISKPEDNTENNPYQQWLFEPSNYNLTAVVMDMSYPQDLKDKLEQYKTRTSLLSGNYIIENEANATIEQTIDKVELKLNSYTVEVKKSESFKVTKDISMSFNIGGNIFGILGINTGFVNGVKREFASNHEKVFRDSVMEAVSYHIRQKVIVPPFNSVKIVSTVDRININVPFKAKIRITGKGDRLDGNGNVVPMTDVEANALRCYLRKENYDTKNITVEKDSLIIDTVGTLEVDGFGLETTIEAIPFPTKNPGSPKDPENPKSPKNPENPESPKNPDTKGPESSKSLLSDPYLLYLLVSTIILYIGYQIGSNGNRQKDYLPIFS